MVHGHNQHANGHNAAYGTVHAILAGKGHQPKTTRPALPTIIGCLFVPWVIFCTTFWLRSFEVRRDTPEFADFLTLCLLVTVLAFAWMTFNLVRSEKGDPKYMAFVATTSFVWFCVALGMGNHNYSSFMRPFYDVSNLNVYPSVDPSKYTGSQLMDAGMIHFNKGTALRLDRAVGFRNRDIFCVAPIVNPNVSEANATYDFWAVGINCCSSHMPDFRCGEYTNPLATWGLRLLDDSKRSMFRLAVMEATATFNLKAPHPVFLYYLSDPTAEVEAYQAYGYKVFCWCLFGTFAAQLFLVLVGLFMFAKM